MDLIKTGAYLRTLRKNRGLSQQELADTLNVSTRTVSRWETGRNLPDLDLLIELSEFYEVELIEILKGESKVNEMNKNVKETLQYAARYDQERELIRISKLKKLFALALLGVALFSWLQSSGMTETGTFTANVADMGLGLAFGTLIAGLLVCSRFFYPIVAWKKRILHRNEQE